MTKVGATMMGAPFEVAYYLIPGILFLIIIILINRLDVFRDMILSRIYSRSYEEMVPSEEESEYRENYESIRREDQRKS
jgi:hypothetical protein